MQCCYAARSLPLSSPPSLSLSVAKQTKDETAAGQKLPAFVHSYRQTDSPQAQLKHWQTADWPNKVCTLPSPSPPASAPIPPLWLGKRNAHKSVENLILLQEFWLVAHTRSECEIERQPPSPHKPCRSASRYIGRYQTVLQSYRDHIRVLAKLVDLPRLICGT